MIQFGLSFLLLLMVSSLTEGLQTTLTTPPAIANIFIVDAPNEILTNVPFRSQGYSFTVKFRSTNALGNSKGEAVYDCGVDPPFLGYVKPWMDLDTGNSVCLFFPYPPEHLMRTLPKLKDMKPYISVSINASLKEHNHVSGSTSAIFVGGFSIMHLGKNIRQLTLTPEESNKTIITILGNTDVQIRSHGQNLLMINSIRKEECGVGRIEYEVQALGSDQFQDKIIVELPSNGQRAEIDVSYEPYKIAKHGDISLLFIFMPMFFLVVVSGVTILVEKYDPPTLSQSAPLRKCHQSSPQVPKSHL